MLNVATNPHPRSVTLAKIDCTSASGKRPPLAVGFDVHAMQLRIAPHVFDATYSNSNAYLKIAFAALIDLLTCETVLPRPAAELRTSDVLSMTVSSRAMMLYLGR